MQDPAKWLGAYRKPEVSGHTFLIRITITHIFNTPCFEAMNRIVSRRPSREEISSAAHQDLIDGIEGDCVLKVMEDQNARFQQLAEFISPDQIDKIHVPYQWTVRQVVEHCAVAERFNGSRMLTMAAGAADDLPGWDQNRFADRRYGLGNFGHLIDELVALRRANILLLRRILPGAWDQSATVDGQRITVRGLAWVTAGHLEHHLRIIAQRCHINPTELPSPSPMRQ